MTALLEVTVLLESLTALLEYLDLLQFLYQSFNVFLLRPGADPGGPVPPLQNFFIYVTIAINIMKIVFNDV